MKTKISRLILALVCLMTASTALAEGIDLKELRYMFENHLETNDGTTEYLFHLEYPMVVTVNHAGSQADSTVLRLWEKTEDGTEYAFTLNLTDAQAFLCLSLPAGHYKLTSSGKGERIHTSCLPELKTNIYA